MKIKKIVCVSIIVLLFSTSFYLSAEGRVIEKSSCSDEKLNAQSDDIEYYALLIGVEKFQDMEDFPEDKIDDGVIAMQDLLLSSKNWKKENIKILLNENATKENIHDSIVNWLDGKETEKDVVLYYFTGHSLKMPLLKRNKGNAYSFPYDIKDFDYSEDKITDIELDSWLDELESNHLTIILDTCYSGRMVSLRQDNRVILTAGGKYFFCGVDESDALGHGIFTFFLLQGFKGIADINNDGWVTSEEAFRYARIPTVLSSIWEEFPFIQKWNNQTIIWFFQIPWIYDHYRGSLPLIEYQYS